MVRKKYVLLLLMLMVWVLPHAEEWKATGLLTDLIEHTDRTWKDGYLSTIPIYEIERSNDQLQYAAIRSSRPSFSWVVPGKGQSLKQLTYHIIVSDSYENALRMEGNVWNSGRVESNLSTAVDYAGLALQPDKTYFWRVKVTTDPSGENTTWSDVKAFRTASTLSEYGVSYYPQVKSADAPVAIYPVASGVQLIDFGKAAFGQLLITLSATETDDTVRIHLGEASKNNRVDRNPDGTIRYHQYDLPLLRGTHTYRIQIRQDERNTGAAAVLMPDYIGEVLPFRYCELEGYDGALAPADITRESVFYPFDDEAAFFQCSNDTLNQIWNLCKYSIKATSFAGIYVDGDRERIPYEADALINQLCHYGVDREYTMARRSHEYLLEHPTWPTEWILQAVLIAWNDYLYTGDSRSLQANYDILKQRTLLHLREKNGLISTTTGLQTDAFQQSIRFNGQIRDIVDWPHTGILGLNKQEGGEADGFAFTDYNVVTNAYHYEALKWMAQIANVLSLPDEASFFDREAGLFKTRFNRLFFDNKQGHYTDGIDESHASLHGNMFPLAFGMVPASKQKSVLDFIHARGMACSVYGSQFLMDALYEAGDAAYALRMLTKTDDRGWYNMIRVGSTISLEAWDNKYKPNQDWNHAWGAVPANIIPRKLVGVEPLIPGFGVVRIRPQIATLDWLKARVPTIKGAIAVEITQSEGIYTLQFTIPANMEAEVYLPLPLGKYTVNKNGKQINTLRVKGEPFIYAGHVASGTYSFAVLTK